MNILYLALTNYAAYYYVIKTSHWSIIIIVTE